MAPPPPSGVSVYDTRGSGGPATFDRRRTWLSHRSSGHRPGRRPEREAASARRAAPRRARRRRETAAVTSTARCQPSTSAWRGRPRPTGRGHDRHHGDAERPSRGSGRCCWRRCPSPAWPGGTLATLSRPMRGVEHAGGDAGEQEAGDEAPGTAARRRPRAPAAGRPRSRPARHAHPAAAASSGAGSRRARDAPSRRSARPGQHQPGRGRRREIPRREPGEARRRRTAAR